MRGGRSWTRSERNRSAARNGSQRWSRRRSFVLGEPTIFALGSPGIVRLVVRLLEGTSSVLGSGKGGYLWSSRPDTMSWRR